MSFKAITTVAGTINANNCVKTPFRYGPITCTPPKVVPAPPNPAATINTAATIKNSFVSFPVTFRRPTINPKTTSNDASHVFAAPRETMPRTIAIITPIIKE